jgi:hypothetical protein
MPVDPAHGLSGRLWPLPPFRQKPMRDRASFELWRQARKTVRWRVRIDDTQTHRLQLFFFGSPIEADKPFGDVDGVAAASFVFFGLRISRLLRFCPLAMTFSSILLWMLSRIVRCGLAIGPES